MIFRPQNGTPEQLSYLRKCAAMIEVIIRTKEFSEQVDKEIVNRLQNYKAANVMFFYKDNMVAGMANEFENLIRLNTKFFGKSLDRSCNTIVHEWLHLLGYDHVSSLDHNSIPYSVGRIVGVLVRNFESDLKKKIWWFWIEWGIIKIGDFVFSLLSIPFLPLAFVLKHKFNVKIPPFSWMLNDTVDGDYGADWWLDREGLEKGLWSALRWWLRNPVWNFRLGFGEVDHSNLTVLKVVSHQEGKSPLDWVEEEGKNEAYYMIDGKLYGRFSYANKWIKIHAGQAGIGDEPKVLRIKIK